MLIFLIQYFVARIYREPPFKNRFCSPECPVVLLDVLQFADHGDGVLGVGVVDGSHVQSVQGHKCYLTYY